jgi:uncharacterized oxidoreductase
MLSVIIDPKALDAPSAEAEAEAFVEWVKASPLAAEAERIMVPGEPEQELRNERGAEGIPIDRTTCQQIADAAKAVGMAPGKVEAFLQNMH